MTVTTALVFAQPPPASAGSETTATVCETNATVHASGGRGARDKCDYRSHARPVQRKINRFVPINALSGPEMRTNQFVPSPSDH
jgi:hypothetical protein